MTVYFCCLSANAAGANPSGRVVEVEAGVVVLRGGLGARGLGVITGLGLGVAGLAWGIGELAYDLVAERIVEDAVVPTPGLGMHADDSSTLHHLAAELLARLLPRSVAIGPVGRLAKLSHLSLLEVLKHRSYGRNERFSNTRTKCMGCQLHSFEVIVGCYFCFEVQSLFYILFLSTFFFEVMS